MSSGAKSPFLSCTTPVPEAWQVAPSFNVLSADSRGGSDLVEGPAEGAWTPRCTGGLGQTPDMNRRGSLCGMLGMPGAGSFWGALLAGGLLAGYCSLGLTQTQASLLL